MSDIFTNRVYRPIDDDCGLDVPMSEFIEMICKAEVEAIKDGIRANSIIINTNMVRVPEFIAGGYKGYRIVPPMVCGLNVYLSKNDLPDGYSFAVFEGPDRGGRLEQFESIGMEPMELRKAAEIYRAIKEKI